MDVSANFRYLSTLVEATTGLGHMEESELDGKRTYVTGDSCLDSLREIQRCLRWDNPETRDAFLTLGKWNTVRENIIPIMLFNKDDSDILLHAVKVAVFLTMPINEECSVSREIQIEYLQQSKAAFLEGDAIACIVTLLESPLLKIESDEATDSDWKLIQLILTLFRNLLAISDRLPQTSSASGGSHYAYLKDDIIERFVEEGVFDLLLAMTQHVEEPNGGLRQDNMLLLEIYCAVFKDQKPRDLLTARNDIPGRNEKKQTFKDETKIKKKPGQELDLLALGRHSRFSGTYMVRNSSRTKGLITRNPLAVDFDILTGQGSGKVSRAKRIAPDVSRRPPSNANVRIKLKEFADQFLENGYSLLMESVRGDIESQHSNVMPSDVLLFFKLAKFFTAYVRINLEYKSLDNSDFGASDEWQPLIGENGALAVTMDEEMFDFVISQWNDYSKESKKSTPWDSVALVAGLVNEMILFVDAVLKWKNEDTEEGREEVRIAQMLLQHVFYDQTETGMLNFLLKSIRSFDKYKQTRSHLNNLIQAVHVSLRLLEDLSRQDRELKVKVKCRKQHKAKSKTAGNAKDPNGDKTDPIQSQAVIDGQDIPPESGGETGQQTMAEETGNKGDLDEEEEGLKENGLGVGEEVGEKQHAESESEDEGEEELTREESMDVRRTVGYFADNSVVHHYSWALEEYSTLNPQTIHYIVRMFRRICEECDMEPIFYQVSVLTTFYSILSDPAMQKSRDHRPLVQFITRVVGHLFERAKAQPMMFVEVLFWKTRMELIDIRSDYTLGHLHSSGHRRKAVREALGDDEDDVNRFASLDTHNDDNPREEVPNLFASLVEVSQMKVSSKRQKKVLFLSEQQEETVLQLFERFKTKRSVAQLIAKEMDPSGLIITKQKVARKLKELGLKWQPNMSNRAKSSVLDSDNENENENENEAPAPVWNDEAPLEDVLMELNLKEMAKEKAEGNVASSKRPRAVFTEEHDAVLRQLHAELHGGVKWLTSVAHKFQAENVTFTYAQICRRLSILGLHTPKKKLKVAAG